MAARTGGDVSGHGTAFCKILAEVTQAWYGDASKYPWQVEYREVKAWWNNRNVKP
jgi:hypothetical protein